MLDYPCYVEFSNGQIVNLSQLCGIASTRPNLEGFREYMRNNPEALVRVAVWRIGMDGVVSNGQAICKYLDKGNPYSKLLDIQAEVATKTKTPTDYFAALNVGAINYLCPKHNLNLAPRRTD